MKKASIFTFLLVALTLISTSNNVLATTYHVANTTHEMPVDQCTTPTEFRAISTTETGLLYNASEMRVPKDTCVQITFVNLQDMSHDFVIDEDVNNSFGMVHIHVMNSTAGMNGSNHMSMNVLTPNADITYEFYCSMPGHRTTMYGNFIVGDGSPSASSPGFELISLFLSVVTILTVVRIRKRN